MTLYPQFLIVRDDIGEIAWRTFNCVVSRDSVVIALTYAALNGLDVDATDIQNT